jgi:drug/metabolite transporter (DMT)-like permease
MRITVAILAICMLITGSINTIATKLQDNHVVGADAHGKPIRFKHPAFQTACMFAGEALCILPFLLRRFLAWRKSAAHDVAHVGASSIPRVALMFALPTAFDAVGSTLLNLGLYFTFASTFQMLRGTLVIFAGLLTILLLQRRLHLQHWLGIALITAGAALVGAASVAFEGPSASAPNPLLGDILVISAMAFSATQFIVEEKFLAQYRAPVLLAVGAEGLWGLLLSAAALPLLSVVHGPGGAPLDSLPEALAQVAASWTLQWTTVVVCLSIAFFNFFGVRWAL